MRRRKVAQKEETQSETLRLAMSCAESGLSLVYATGPSARTVTAFGHVDRFGLQNHRLDILHSFPFPKDSNYFILNVLSQNRPISSSEGIPCEQLSFPQLSLPANTSDFSFRIKFAIVLEPDTETVARGGSESLPRTFRYRGSW